MSTERQREMARQRLARWRARHKVKHAIAAEQVRKPRGGSQGVWRVVEVVDGDNVPISVVACRIDSMINVPPGCRVSYEWLPAVRLSREAALRLAEFRQQQIARWCGGDAAAGGETPAA